MKKILLIQGHPQKDSFCHSLGAAYVKGAQQSGAEIKQLSLSEMSFDPNLKHGYATPTELEACLQEAQKMIKWADHLVFVYPIWWGSMPAKLKGFFDRTLLPGYAFQYRKNSPWWDKLLKGRSARVIVTSDTPGWYFKLVYRSAGHVQIKKLILQFCGIKPVKLTHIAPIKNSKLNFREKWLEKVEQLGRKGQ